MFSFYYFSLPLKYFETDFSVYFRLKTLNCLKMSLFILPAHEIRKLLLGKKQEHFLNLQILKKKSSVERNNFKIEPVWFSGMMNNTRVGMHSHPKRLPEVKMKANNISHSYVTVDIKWPSCIKRLT